MKNRIKIEINFCKIYVRNLEKSYKNREESYKNRENRTQKLQIAKYRISFEVESDINRIEIGKKSDENKNCGKKNRTKIVRIGTRSGNDLTLFLYGSLSDRTETKIGHNLVECESDKDSCQIGRFFLQGYPASRLLLKACITFSRIELS
jgi:mRNA-degrading endonuclease RelE of RelBE toxin-antitoxin system